MKRCIELKFVPKLASWIYAKAKVVVKYLNRKQEEDRVNDDICLGFLIKFLIVLAGVISTRVITSMRAATPPPPVHSPGSTGTQQQH
jgi:hypothetical protein